MPAHHSFLGIEFSEAKIRLARAGTKPFTVSASHAVTVPKNAIVKGVVENASVLVPLISEAAASLLKGGNECVALIPSDIVHNFVFTYPTADKRPSIATLLTEKLGEPSHAFVIVSHTLETGPTTTTVGVSAVRRQWLQTYLSICKNAGLTVRAVSTAPAMAILNQKEKTASPHILVYVPSVDEKSSISLVRSGWIDQDIVISAKRGFTKIFQSAAKMKSAASVKHILIHASDDAIVSCKKTFSSATKKNGKAAVARALPIAEEDRVYAGAIAASACSPASLQFNLFQKNQRNTKHLIALGLIVFAIVFTALMFVQ